GNPTKVVLDQGAETVKVSLEGVSAIQQVTLAHTLPAPLPRERLRTLILDREYKEIVPGSLVVIDRLGEDDADVRQVITVDVGSFSDYGLTASATVLTLDGDWLRPSERSIVDL